MRTLLPLLALFVIVPVVSADVGMPGFKFTSGSRVVHFGPGAERYRLFAVCHNRCAALELTTDNTARVPHLGPRGMGESLCAVPADAPIPETPTVEWLKAVPGAIWSEQFGEFLRRDYVFFDPREGYALHYRATFTTDKLELELIEERTEWSKPTVLVMGFLSMALALGGIWVVRRLRRSVTRTAPPNQANGAT